MMEIADSNIKDRNTWKKLYIGGIIAVTIWPQLLLIIFSLFELKYVIFCLVWSTVPDAAMFFNLWEMEKNPPRQVRIIFSDVKIDIYLQNRFYFQQFKDDLRAIEIIKKKNYPDYDLNFVGWRKRTIRLTCIMIHEKKTKEVLDFVKKWGENLNIPVNLQEIKKFYTKEYEQDKKVIEEWFKTPIS